MVGDVAGKGVDAARRAAYVRATLANFALYADGPAQLLEMCNRALIDAIGVSDRFVTVACVMVQPARRAVTWASAGHPAPVRLDDGTMLPSRPGLPLGLRAPLDLEEQLLDVESGGGLLLYTDGLSEARRVDADDPELLGMARVATEIRAHANAPPEEIATRLHDVVAAHSDGKLADDLCMIALRVTSDTRSAAAPEERAVPAIDA